jgi:chemotaxis protein CheD
MATLEMSNTAKETLVGMGQLAAGRAPERMKAVLGSCIGLAIYHPRLKTGIMAHIVLPDSAGRKDGKPGKYADTAVPTMLARIQELGAPRSGLVAKLAGGANMFSGSGPLQIGDANAQAVLRAVEHAAVRVVGQDLGGTKGRRVTFDCAGGQMKVECVGQPAQVF